MKSSIPRNSRSTRRAFTSCLLSFAILIMPFAQIAAARSGVNQTRRGTSPTVREGSSAPDQQRAAAKDLFVAPVGTTLSTTLSAAITPTGNNGDGKADPGDTITYTATITNTGASDAPSVSFTDTVDLSTTLISGSGVLALDDHFNTIGNVDLNVPVAQGLLLNDKDITAGNNTGMTASGGTSSAQGGTVAISSNGSFTYTPPVGFTGSDTFTYTATTAGGKTATATARIAIAGKLWFINNNAAACASTCDGRLSHPFTTVANFNAVNDNGVALSHPKTGDSIFIYESASAYTGPVTLLNNQTLIGQDATASLITITGLTQPSGTEPLPVMNSGNGTIVNLTSASNAIPILVGNSNTLRGFTVGNTTGAKIVSTGANFGTLTTSDLTLTGTGQALNLTSGTLAATFNNITSTSSAVTTPGISLASVGGTLTVSGTTAISNSNTVGINIAGSSLTANFGTTNVGPSGSQGILIGTTTSNITFGATIITGGSDSVSFQNNNNGSNKVTFASLSTSLGSGSAFLHGAGGGNVTVSGAATLSSAGTAVSINTPTSTNAINFQGATSATSTGSGNTGVNWVGTSGAALTFNSLSIVTNAGTGLNATTGGTVTVTNGTGTINNTTQAAPAVVANGVALNANFSAINSSGGASGVSLTNVTGTSSFGNGAISGNSGDAFVVSGSTSSVTYNGTIASGSAHSVNVNGKSSGTVNFGGAITDSDTGITLTSNSGATINFTGGLSLSTVGNDAFTATGGGTVNVSGTNNITTTLGKGINWSADTSSTGVTFNNITSTTGGAVIIASSGASNFTFNDVTSTTGTAVNVNTSTGDFVFHKISSNGAAKGITVSALTGAGSFTVTGTGGTGLCDSTHIGASDCQGGTIQSASSRGIEFTNAVGITLKNMYLKNDGTTGIALGATCNPDVGAGNNTGCNAALYFNGAATVSLDRMFLDGGSGSSDNGINANGVNGFSLTNSEVRNFSGNQKDAANIQNPSGTWTIGTVGNPVTFDGNQLSHNVFITSNSGTSNITFTNTTISNSPLSGTGNASGISALSRSGSVVNITATSCTFSKVVSNAVNWASAAGGNMTAVFSNNTATEVDTIDMTSTGNNSILNYTITGNTITTQPTTGHTAVNVGRGSVAPNGTNMTGTGTVTSNNITVNSSTCSTCFGIQVSAEGASGNSVTTVSNNTIAGNVAIGIRVLANAGGQSLNLTMQGNTMSTTQTPANASYGIDIQSGGGGSDTNCLWLNLGDMSGGTKNNVNGSWTNGSPNKISLAVFDSAQFKMVGYGGANDAAAAAYAAAHNNGGVDAFHLGSNPFTGGASCPLLLALGGIASARDMFPLVRSFDGSEVSEVSVASLASPVSTVSNSLSQSQLDSIVATSIQRWSAAGLTQPQIATLRGIKFEVTDLSGSYLGEADGNRIQVDRDAEGKGWFVDASPMSDASFAHAVSATRLYTDSMNAAAGHVDLLTAIEHEMGHRLGLDDKYAEKDRDSIMYGYLTVGERRLPARGQAKGARAGTLASAHFLSIGSNDRIPAGDEFNSRGHRPRIDASGNVSDPVRVALIRPLQGRNARMNRVPVALPPAIESHAFGVNQRGHIALRRSAANQLGAGVYKHSVPTARRSNHATRRTTAPLTPFVGGTITVSIGTLKPGDSAQITFQVTLNSPPDLTGVPPGTAQVSTHGTVTGSNFSSPQDTNTVNTLVDRYDVTNVLTATPNPSDQGVQVTFTATVSPVGTPPATVGGFVNFIDTSNANAVLCNAPVSAGVANCQTSSLTASTHNVRADYLGDGNFDPLSSNVVAQVVNACTSNPIVTSTADSGANTLRDALLHVCTQPSNNITFNLGAGAHTITSLSTLVIAKNANITNTLSAGNGPLTIDANGGAFRVFRVDSPVTAASLANFTIKGAASNASGGGLFVQSGTVTLTGMLFTASTVISGSGGGAGVTGGATLNIRNSTFSGNTATNGGALYNSGGILNLLNVTVTNNNANGDVGTGACPAAGSVNGEGGAIDNGSSTTNVKNSILAGNLACNTGLLNISGTITDQGNNLLSGDPRVAPLANNGGASWTHALLVDSPALDAGDNTVVDAIPLTIDQRDVGYARKRDSATDADSTITVDIGAFESDPTIENIGDQTTSEDTPLQFVFRVGDVQLSFDSVTATSSNSTLLPNANVSVLADTTSTRKLLLTPLANETGTSTITVTATKTIGGQTLNMTDTFVLTVTEVNDTPVAGTDGLTSVAEDSGQRTIPIATLLSNDSAGPTNESSQTLTLTGVSNAVGGTLGSDPTNVYFTPNSDFNGAASFDYTITDNGTTNGSSDPKSANGQVTFTITEVNDVPVPAADSLTSVAENSGQRLIPFSDLTANDNRGAANESGQSLAVKTVSNPVNGSVTLDTPNSRVLFTPTSDFNGPASFDYTVEDNGTTNGLADAKTSAGSATASFTDTEVNDAPTATGETIANIAEGSGVNAIPFATLTGNDSAGPGNESSQVLIVKTVSNPTGGTVAINGANVEFTPTSGYNGAGSFDYTVEDDGTTNGSNDPKTSNTATASFTITQVNDAPVNTVPGAITIPLNTVLTFSGANLISVADIDAAEAPSDGVITVTLNSTNGTLNLSTTVGLSFNSGSNPSAAMSFSGTIPAINAALNGMTFTPANNYTGPASVQIVSNDQGKTGSGGIKTDDDTVNITVSAVDTMYINEVLLNPPGTDAPNQYIELRGTPGATIPAGTYFVAIAGNSADNPGDVRAMINLSGLTFGSNGFLVLLQTGNTYTTQAGATVVSSTVTPGFSGLPGGIFQADGGATDIVGGSFTFMLIQSGVAPTLADDIDSNDDDLTNGPVFAGWSVRDSINLMDSSANALAYGAFGYRNSAGSGSSLGGEVIVGFIPGYVGRVGDSTGSTPADWVASGVLGGAAPNWTLGVSTETEPAAFAGKLLNHIGASNFVNLPPVNNVPAGTQSVNEDFTLTFNSGNSNLVSISDPDANSAVVKVTLTATNGTMSLSGTGGLTFTPAGTSNDGTNDTQMIFTGAIANINAALSGMTFTPTTNYFGAGTIQIVTDDQGNTGVGGAQTDSDTVNITVNPINDPPSFVNGSNPTVTEDAGPQTVSGWATSISQGPGESGQALAFNVTANGTTGNLAFSSGPAIDASGNLTYTTSPNTNGSATFNVSLSDSGSNASPNSNTSGTQSFTINVGAVNDAPSFQIPSNPSSVNEDVGLQTVNGFATNFQTGPLTATDESGQTLVGYTVTQAGSTGGLTFTSGPSIDNAGKLTYTPAADKSGTATFNVVATDSGSGTVPNVNQSAPVSFTITVTAVNDAPVLDNTGNLSLTAINEDVVNASNPGTLVSDMINSAGGDRITDVDSGAVEGIAVTAVDNTNGAWQFSIDNGANWIAFGTPNTLNTRLLAANALTRVRFIPGVNFNGTIDPGINFRAWDQTSGSNGNTADTTTTGGSTAFSTATEAASIIVNPVNDPPSFTKGIDQNVLVNQGAQTVTPWATAISFGPANEAGQTVAFAVTVNTNAALFSVAPVVNPSGTLTYTTANDAVGSATITIVLQDNGGGTDTSAPQSFTINVAPGNATTALISSANPSVFGVSNTFTATVTANSPSGGTPQGTVNFKDGASTIGSGTLNASGVATFSISSLTVGSHTITAQYVASSSFNASTSSSVTQIVRANPAVSVVSSQNPSNLGANVTFTATVTAPAGVAITPTGTVQFKDGGTNIGAPVTCAAAPSNTCTAQVSTSTLTSGTHVITADYAGDASFNPFTGTLSGGQIVSALIRFSSATYATTESSFAATLTVERVGDLTSTVSVDYATPDDSAATPTILPCSTPGFVSSRCDFTTTIGRLTFAPGETSKTFAVQISQDNYVEGPESFTLTLSNVSSNAVLGSPSTATLTITDDASEQGTNPIDTSSNFVRQHYHDFLNREPVPGDQAGLDFWTNQIESCGADQTCRDIKRQNVSGAFFLSIEFQQTGYFVYRTYKAGLGDINSPTVPVPVRYLEFIRDTQQVQAGVVVGQGSWQAQLDTNKQAFALAFVNRPEFLSRFPALTSATAFVNGLDANAGNVLTSSERSTLITELSANPTDAALRADVLMKVAENATLKQQQFNRAFVLMQYFGYLRRNPDAAPEAGLNFSGFNFWLNKLNSFNGNFMQAEMVKAFINSGEYRGRFGP